MQQAISITTRLPQPLAARLGEAAASHSLARSALMRMILSDWLSDPEPLLIRPRMAVPAGVDSDGGEA